MNTPDTNPSRAQESNARREPPTHFDLHGRVALVTGGGRGLGFKMAHSLAQAGAIVYIDGRSEDILEACRQAACAAWGWMYGRFPSTWATRQRGSRRSKGSSESLIAWIFWSTMLGSD